MEKLEISVSVEGSEPLCLSMESDDLSPLPPLGVENLKILENSCRDPL